MELKKYFDKEFWIYFIIYAIIFIGLLYYFTKRNGVDLFLSLVVPVLLSFVLSYLFLNIIFLKSKIGAFFTIFLPTIFLAILGIIFGIIFVPSHFQGEGILFFLIGSAMFGGIVGVYLLIIYIIKLIASKQS